jgi:hypothetical protein
VEGKASTKTAANANAGLADVQDMNALRSNLDELVTHTNTLVNMIAIPSRPPTLKAAHHRLLRDRSHQNWDLSTFREGVDRFT